MNWKENGLHNFLHLKPVKILCWLNSAFRDRHFYYEHLLDSSDNLQLIQDFCVTNTSGYGLERYIKELTESNEKDGSARTYLVKDKFTHEIVAYFSLKSGLFTIDAGNDFFYSISGIELANFAVNSSYRKNHPDAKNLESTVFAEFVLHFVNFIRSLVGIQAIYIYALPDGGQAYKAL